jgi:hypothetical protein
MVIMSGRLMPESRHAKEVKTSSFKKHGNFFHSISWELIIQKVGNFPKVGNIFLFEKLENFYTHELGIFSFRNVFILKNVNPFIKKVGNLKELGIHQVKNLEKRKNDLEILFSFF